MDAQTRMDRSIEAVVHDLEMSLQRVNELRTVLGTMKTPGADPGHIQRMNELVADLNTRIEGIEAFIQECQRRAHAHEQPPEEIDLWL